MTETKKRRKKISRAPDPRGRRFANAHAQLWQTSMRNPLEGVNMRDIQFLAMLHAIASRSPVRAVTLTDRELASLWAKVQHGGANVALATRAIYRLRKNGFINSRNAFGFRYITLTEKGLTLVNL